MISLMGLVPAFFEIATKQRQLPGYAGEIPCVTAARKILAPSLKLIKREKMTESSGKEKDHSL